MTESSSWRLCRRLATLCAAGLVAKHAISLAKQAKLVRRVVARCLVALALAGSPALSRQAGASPASESDVKGVFVLNFVRFVSWSSIQGEAGDALPVCALANSDFAAAVRRAVAGKTAQNRSIVFRFDADPDPSRCRVLVVDAGEYRTALPALNAVSGAAVLTIGNGPGLIELGGMFELVVEDRKVRFNTNLEAIRRANLQVSANLLHLSRNLTIRHESDDSR
jgi:hypothetical protein